MPSCKGKENAQITDVWIDPGCITCGVCEFIAPEVFEVTDISHVKGDADCKVFSQKITRLRPRALLM